MKRINAFDIIRGIAVLFLIILHTGLHHWAGVAEVESGVQESDPMLNVLVFFVTLGGIFYTIMGTVNSYMFYHRVRNKENTIKQMVQGSLIMGGGLLALHFIFRIFLSADSGILFHLVMNGKAEFPNIVWLISSSTLPMLGYNYIIVAAFLALLLKNTDWNDLRRQYTVLGVFGTIIIVGSLPLRMWLAPIVDQWIVDGYIGRAWILAPFVYDNFPIFPFAGFGLYGAILGLMLAHQEKQKVILTYTGVQASIWFSIGLIGIKLRGGIDPALSLLHTREGAIEDFFRHMGQLGICFIFFIAALVVFDYIPKRLKKEPMKYFGWLRRFGLLSLTAYLFEGLITAIFRRVMDLFPFMEGWNESIINVIIFGVGMAVLWGIAAKYWEKIGFKGSVEWDLIQLISTCGKHSKKYCIDRDNDPTLIKKTPILSERS